MVILSAVHGTTPLSPDILIAISHSVKDFKEFADAVEAVKNKGIVVAVASPEDVAAANEQTSGFFSVKKVL